METHYENVKEKIIKQQLEASTPLAYKSEFNVEGKEKIFKDIYSIKAWKRLCEFFQSQEREIE